MQITAAMVKELRERTGAGMMECKKALVEADGNLETAIEQMRISGLAKADKKSGRVAAEGVIAMTVSDSGNGAAMVEVNCETDFVSKGDDFAAFANAVSARVFNDKPADVEALTELPLSGDDDRSINTARQELVTKIGENIQVRRFVQQSTDNGVFGSYSHSGRIGVLVCVEGGDATLAKDIAMHVAASRPECISEADVPAELLEKEKAILMAEAQESGKPAEIIEKMVAGRVKKYLAEITLVGQAFVKDPDMTVGKLLSNAGASVSFFERYEVGEGIEKKEENFADEVMAQVHGS
ncbi:MAG: translation elongation factor Ts [Pseudomonadota bacterium]